MWPTIIVTAAIFLYASFVVVRKIKKMKQGEFCSCGCEHCSSPCKNIQKIKVDLKASNKRK